MGIRTYQLNVIIEARRLLVVAKQSERRVLIVSPTGSGKTVTAAEMIQNAIAKGTECLFLAHRTELIGQTSEKLDALGIDHGIIQSDNPRRKEWLKIQVASVATLVNRIKHPNKWKPNPRLIFIDEAHRARAKSYHDIIDAFPDAAVIGFTATPWRSDGKGLGEMFYHLAVAAKPSELLRDGWLVPCDGFSFMSPDLSKMSRSSTGDFKEVEASQSMKGILLSGAPVQDYIKHSMGKRGIYFLPDVEQSKMQAQQFRDAGVPALHLDAYATDSERSAALGALKSGEIKVLCNVGLYIEGLDVPSIEVVGLCAPTASVSRAMQMVGRGMRNCCLDCHNSGVNIVTDAVCPQCGSANLKKLCRIHDHARVLAMHGLPDEDRDYSLDADTKGSALSPRSCLKCLRISPAGSKCCRGCGVEFPVSQRARDAVEMMYVDATLVDLATLRRIRDQASRATMTERAAEYLRLEVRAKATGMTQKWVSDMFRAQFGVRPSFSAALLRATRPGSEPWLTEDIVQGNIEQMKQEILQTVGTLD